MGKLLHSFCFYCTTVFLKAQGRDGLRFDEEIKSVGALTVFDRPFFKKVAGSGSARRSGISFLQSFFLWAYSLKEKSV